MFQPIFDPARKGNFLSAQDRKWAGTRATQACVVGEYHYRTIQINDIIHLNTGTNMLTLFLKYHYLDHHFASARFSDA